MPRTKKADQKKGDDKTAAPVQGAQEQTEDTTATQGAQKQTEDTTATQEAQEQAEDTATQERVSGVKTTEEEAAAMEAELAEGKCATLKMNENGEITLEEPERDLFAGIPNPCVYCGPTVRGVARQYTTYQGGIPDTLRDFIKGHPEARELIVSTAEFPGLRKRLDTPGTDAAKIYKKVKERL